MSVHYVLVSGDDGSMLPSTWDTGAPEPLTVGDPNVVGVLNDVLKDQRIGVRIVIAAPATAATADAAASPAMVMVMEVLDAKDVPTRASGQAVVPPAGLPVVTLADNGEPSITIPADAQKPTTLVAQTLIKGAGRH